jgi:hypothetical protein
MSAYVTITNYGAETTMICPVCEEQIELGSDDRAAAAAAAEHNARHHAAD